MILNDSGVHSTKLRAEGFLDTIAGHQDYHLVEQYQVNTELETGMEKMKEIINDGVTFDVVLGGNDPTAMGCLAAMQMTHMEEHLYDIGRRKRS